MKFPILRSYPLHSPTPEMVKVLAALGRQAKNIRNRATFFIRNVFSAFDENGVLREITHPNVGHAISVAETHIELINAKRIEKAKGRKKPPKLLRPIRETPWAILDPTLLDNIVRSETDIAPEDPYAAVPAALAQGMIQIVCSDWKSWRRALAEYAKTPAKFSGRPAMPRYQEKDSLSTFEIPIQRTNRKNLPPIGKKRIACDMGCKELLSAEEKALWDKYDLGKEIAKLVDHVPAAATPNVFRVTFRKGKPQFVVVFEIETEIPDDSIMAYAYGLAYKKAGTRTKRNGEKVQKRPTEAMLVEALKTLPPTDKVAGLDFGLTNLVSMGFADGTEGVIVAAQRLVAKMAYQNKKIDDWKSANMPVRLKELQGKKAAKASKLTRAENIELRSLYAELYRNPEYIKLQGKINRWCDDAFKKVSAGVIKLLASRKIEALVVGLNKDWKKALDMGSKMNRAFHGMAHTRILGMLRNAGERRGILVVSIEESYTSKVSFVNDVRLRTFGEEGCPCQGDSVGTKLPRNGELRKKNGGQRGRKDRHVYRNEGCGEGKPKNWRKVMHADINGAFNILRKMFSWFSFNENLSLDYDLYWLSPKSGLTPMKIF